MTEQDQWLAERIQDALAPTTTQEERLYARLREAIQEAPRDETVLWQSFTRLMTTAGTSVGHTLHAAARTPWWRSDVRPYGSRA